MKLPSHPSVRSTDPLGICSSDDYDVPLWDVLSTLLQQKRPQNSHDLLDLLTDIAASTGRAESAGGYEILTQLLQHPQTAHSFFSGGLPAMLDIALQLPTLFPTHTLQTLQPGTHAVLALTRRQVYCLIVHMFLGTLQAPPWQHWWVDFGIWQHSSSSSSSRGSIENQAGVPENISHSEEPSARPAEGSIPVLDSPAAVYLHILLTYFNQLAEPQYANYEAFWNEALVITRVHILPAAAAAAAAAAASLESCSIGSSGSGNSSNSCAADTAGSSDACREAKSSAAAAASDCPSAVHWAASSMPLLPLQCCETELCNVQGNCLLQQQLVGYAGSAQVVFCNRDVGFGSSGTQEEQVFGSSPELCILMLCCPSLRDDETLLVQGPILHGLISGFGQNTTYRGLASDCPGFKGVDSWQDRVLVFMDALELDEWRSGRSSSEGDGMAAAAAAAVAAGSDVQVNVLFIPDLLPEHVSRELDKAFCAFSAAAAAAACRRRGSSRVSQSTSCYAASIARSEALTVPAAAAEPAPAAAATPAPAAAAAAAAVPAALDLQDQHGGINVAGNPVVIATGHWGCGAFGGNREVKALLQLMAASQAGCRLLFSDVGPSSSSSRVLHHGQQAGLQEEQSQTLDLQAQGPGSSGSSSKSFGRQLADLVDQLHSVGVTVGELHGVLLQLCSMMGKVTAAQRPSNSSSGGREGDGRMVIFDAVAAILLRV